MVESARVKPDINSHPQSSSFCYGLEEDWHGSHGQHTVLHVRMGSSPGHRNTPGRAAVLKYIVDGGETFWKRVLS